jgi:hypothetical protein
LREGRRQLEQHRWRHPDPIPRSRRERLLLAAGRLEADLDVERRANAAYEHNRVTARDRLGRRLGGGRRRMGRPTCPPARSPDRSRLALDPGRVRDGGIKLHLLQP